MWRKEDMDETLEQDQVVAELKDAQGSQNLVVGQMISTGQ
jgi:hypothetical protein